RERTKEQVNRSRLGLMKGENNAALCVSVSRRWIDRCGPRSLGGCRGCHADFLDLVCNRDHSFRSASCEWTTDPTSGLNPLGSGSLSHGRRSRRPWIFLTVLHSPMNDIVTEELVLKGSLSR